MTSILSPSSQVILNYLFFGYNLQKAIKEPRVHSQLNPDKTFVEDHFEEVKFVHSATTVYKRFTKSAKW